jgi:hypothetical protein
MPSLAAKHHYPDFVGYFRTNTTENEARKIIVS